MHARSPSSPFDPSKRHGRLGYVANATRPFFALYVMVKS